MHKFNDTYLEIIWKIISGKEIIQGAEDVTMYNPGWFPGPIPHT